MNVVSEARDALGLSKRRSVLGLPIGPKRTDWTKAALWGTGATAGVVGSVALLRGGGTQTPGPSDPDTEARDVDPEEDPEADDADGQSGPEPDQATDEQHPPTASEESTSKDDWMERGEQLLDTAEDLAPKIAAITQAVRGKSTTYGKVKGAIQASKESGIIASDDDDDGGGIHLPGPLATGTAATAVAIAASPPGRAVIRRVIRSKLSG